jgi:xanthine dehydrogenase accessory factor
VSTRTLLEAFDRWRHERQPIVLATVFETLGSTYSKAGHRILIAANGDYQGLVSGGCLEGDLAERARAVLDEKRPAAVTYDMRDEADDIWGLGVGCNGLIRVFLQPLYADQEYQPFAAIAERLRDTEPSVVLTLVESAQPELEVGATLVSSRGSNEVFGAGPKSVETWLSRWLKTLDAATDVLESGRSRYVRDASDNGVLLAVLKPIPRLLVLGAGQDAVPLVDMAAALGWSVTVADHRPAYLERGGFEAAESAMTIDPRRLDEAVDPASFDAVIVMSHHLLTDQAYLEQLARYDLGYVGVLGPPARKARLLDALGDAAGPLAERLRGPVGLDIGADSPESIALSILAELQCVLAGRPLFRVPRS